MSNITIVKAHEIARNGVFEPVGEPLTQQELDDLNTGTIEIVEHRTSGPGIWRNEYMSMIFVTKNDEHRLFIAKLDGDTEELRAYE